MRIAVLVSLDGGVVPELLEDDGRTVLQDLDDLVGSVVIARLGTDHALQAGLEAVRELRCHVYIPARDDRDYRILILADYVGNVKPSPRSAKVLPMPRYLTWNFPIVVTPRRIFTNDLSAVCLRGVRVQLFY